MNVKVKLRKPTKLDKLIERLALETHNAINPRYHQRMGTKFLFACRVCCAIRVAIRTGIEWAPKAKA